MVAAVRAPACRAVTQRGRPRSEPYGRSAEAGGDQGRRHAADAVPPAARNRYALFTRPSSSGGEPLLADRRGDDHPQHPGPEHAQSPRLPTTGWPQRQRQVNAVRSASPTRRRTLAVNPPRRSPASSPGHPRAASRLVLRPSLTEPRPSLFLATARRVGRRRDHGDFDIPDQPWPACAAAGPDRKPQADRSTAEHESVFRRPGRCRAPHAPAGPGNLRRVSSGPCSPARAAPGPAVPAQRFRPPVAGRPVFFGRPVSVPSGSVPPVRAPFPAPSRPVAPGWLGTCPAQREQSPRLPERGRAVQQNGTACPLA